MAFNHMTRSSGIFASLFLVVLLSLSLTAQPAPTARFDDSIVTSVTQKLAEKPKYHSVHSAVEGGIVTLTGSVDLYQDKLDVAKDIGKLKNVLGVRNLVTISGPAVSDAQLEAELARKIYYDRMGYFDYPFNDFTLAVKDGVVILGGQSYNDWGRDSALAIVRRTAGVKEVISKVQVSPASIFDDQLRRQAMRVIYGDSVLSRYATDPARPIRIIVDNGHLSLYGTVQNSLEKQTAGMRASSLPGAFSVQNNLVVDSDAKAGM